ncbi:MAG: acyltransferase [Treponema sp.]|nr:acyltransferase [Treponema sp.]
MIKKNESIQVLRGLLFLWVFFLHMSDNCLAGNPLEFLSVSITPFFVMSGFLLMLKDSKEEKSKTFNACFYSMKKRISRLYPLHVLTSLFIFLLLCARSFHGGGLMERIGELTISLFLNILLIQSWFPKYAVSLNAPTWYLSAAAFLYFMYPVIKNIVYRFNKLALFGAIIIFRLVFAAFFILLAETLNYESLSFWACYYLPVFRSGDFIIGCLAGLIYKECRGKICATNLQASIMQVCVAIFGILFFSIKTDASSFFIRVFFKSDVVRIILSAVWIFLFMEGKGIVRFLTKEPLVALGNISGICYMIHWPVIEIMRAVKGYFNLDFSKWTLPQLYLLILVNFILTIIVSYLWLYISKKIQAIKEPALEKSS